MILTVTCNPALDMTYSVDRLVPGQVHRVKEVVERAGGKGVNVARVLHQLGEPVHALGLGDSSFGPSLAELGIRASFLDVMARLRRTLVVQGEETTSLWEPGSPVPADAADSLVELVGTALPGARALVVSGSLPPGVPAGLPGRLASLAHDAGVPVVLDLDGAALQAALERGGAILTPNLDELRTLTDTRDSDLLPTVKHLADVNGAPVVLTLGERGLLAVTEDGCWLVTPPERVEGNPTGAGDATNAGIALGLAHGLAWPELLCRAVALGAAAVRRPVAGEVDLSAYASFTASVRAQRVDAMTFGD